MPSHYIYSFVELQLCAGRAPPTAERIRAYFINYHKYCACTHNKNKNLEMKIHTQTPHQCSKRIKRNMRKMQSIFLKKAFTLLLLFFLCPPYRARLVYPPLFTARAASSHPHPHKHTHRHLHPAQFIKKNVASIIFYGRRRPKRRARI